MPEYRSNGRSSHPVRLGRPVTAPYSLPRLRRLSPASVLSSLGNGPSPTRVQYALLIPITELMALGATPVPMTAPPEVALDDVTNGYVPWSISSIVPCAPSNRIASPPARALFSKTAVSQTNGAIFSAAAAYSVYI